MNRLHFLGLRLVRTLATLVIIVFITFAIFSLWPSDPATLACGRPCTPENLERARAFMGYDLPWYTQFWHYLQGIVGGRTFGEGSGAIACASPCLGYSFRLSTPVSELVATRLPVTASIAVGAAVLWLAIGVGAGVVSALRRGSRLDRTIMTGTVLGISSPAYLVGLLGILLFGFTLDMVPVSGYVPFADSPLDWACTSSCPGASSPSSPRPSTPAWCVARCWRTSARTTCAPPAPSACPSAASSAAT